MNKLKSLQLSLQGHKTHILVILGCVVVVLKFLDVLDATVADTLLGLLGFGAASAIKAGVARSLPKG